jgi:tripeptidyl-peptidase-1
MFSPSAETVAAVKQWLVNSGISANRVTHSDNKGWLAFDASAAEAESLMGTEYHTYEHSVTGHVATACDQYVLLALGLLRTLTSARQVPRPQAHPRAH